MKKRGFKKQVDPRAAAVAIVIALTVIQVVWWRFLVWKPHVLAFGPRASSAPRGGPAHVYGRDDVLVDTLAGTPAPGLVDGPGRDSKFDGPTGLAIDTAGNLYVADCRNNVIRLIRTDGTVSTLAGGKQGFADGPAGVSAFTHPTSVAVAPNGTLYVADTGNNAIRQIAAGRVTTLAAGTGSPQNSAVKLPCAVAVQLAPPHNIAVACAQGHVLLTFSPAGKLLQRSELVAAASAIDWSGPLAVAIPQGGTLLVSGKPLLTAGKSSLGSGADGGTGTIYVARPASLCHGAHGWFATGTGQGALYYLHSGGVEVIAGVVILGPPEFGYHDSIGHHATFGVVTGLVCDGKGHIFATDTTNNAIRRITLPAELTQ